MKTMALNFGFSVVNAGQRNSNSVNPEVIALSTTGMFRITGAASRALNLASGENIMFVNNIDKVDDAIINESNPMHANLITFCKENNIVLGTPEANVLIHKTFDMWAVAKGILEVDSMGNAKKCRERISRKDKVTYVTNNFEAMMKAIAESTEEGSDELRDALNREGITKDEQIELLTTVVVPREIDSYKGSKCSNVAGLTGIGANLTFADTNIWNQLKADLNGDDRNSVNRVFAVDINNPITVEIYDGHDKLMVPALILSEGVDRTPARKGEDDDDDTQEPEAGEA